MLKNKILFKLLNHNNFRFSYKSPKDVFIPREQLDIQYCRSSGPGGQNVNKVNSKAEVRMNIESQHWLADYIKIKLREKYPNFINKEGELIVTS